MEVKKNWKLVLYGAIASALCSALSFLGLFIAECNNCLGWEIGLVLAFATFGCTAALLLVLYAVPFIVKFIIECFEYFTRHR